MSQDLRALLRDRKKTGRNRNVAVDFCLNLDLLDELADLRAERESAERPFLARMKAARDEREDSLAGPADTSGIEAERDEALAELDQQIADKKKEIREASVTIHFRAVGSRFDQLANETQADESNENRLAFMDLLLAESFVKITQDGEPTDLTWADIAGADLTQGDLDPIRAKVYAANKVSADIPFSLKRSGKTP